MAELFNAYSIPARVRKQVVQQIAVLAFQKHRAQTGEIISCLPDTLQGELCYAMRSRFIIKYIWFRFLDGGFQMCFKNVCQRAISQLYVQSEEIIFGSGELRSGMLFVEKGSVQYAQSTKAQALSVLSTKNLMDHAFSAYGSGRHDTEASLGDHPQSGQGSSSAQNVDIGHWLSEAALFIQWRATGDATAACGTWLLLVDTSAFAEEVTRFPLVLAKVALYVHHVALCAAKFDGTKDCTDLYINLEALDFGHAS